MFKGLVWSGFFPFFLGKTETKLVLEILKFSCNQTEPSRTGLYQSSVSCNRSGTGLFISDFLRYVLPILSICVVLLELSATDVVMRHCD